jgi:hypothetical protein
MLVWKHESCALAASGYPLVLEDGPDLSDPSDEGNKPDDNPNMCAPGCTQGHGWLAGYTEACPTLGLLLL